MKKIVSARLTLCGVSGVAALATYAFLVRPWHRWGAKAGTQRDMLSKLYIEDLPAH